MSDRKVNLNMFGFMDIRSSYAIMELDVCFAQHTTVNLLSHFLLQRRQNSGQSVSQFTSIIWYYQMIGCAGQRTSM